MSLQEKDVIKNIDRFGELSVNILNMITNSSATLEQKTEMLFAVKEMFDIGINLIEATE